ncbi:MAG: hypothetical protein HYX32_06445 [Actinobacteria bacterium]|nr:hypothetical protein [Actinomycetota bacterium]
MGRKTMSAEGNDRGGVKAPRTLFSLGRPGAKPPREGGESTAMVESDGVAIDDVPDAMEIQYACGACGALLPSGASFCGECGTPVAMDGDEDEDDGMLDELVEMDEQPAVVPGQEPRKQPELIIDPAASALEDRGEAAAGVESVAEVAAAEEKAGTSAAAGTDLPGPEAAGQGSPAGQAPGQFDPSTTAQLAPLSGLVAEAKTPESEPTPPSEPAAVLYADPTMAEPLPPPAEGSWAVSEPMVGNAHGAGVDESQDAPEKPGGNGKSPAAGAALAGGAVGAAGAIAGEQAAASAAEAPAAAWAVVPEAEPGEAGGIDVPPGLVGTTAQSMPYGTGPVESSARGSRGPLIAAVVVVGLLLIGAIAFALTRGGGGNDVATSPSSTAIPAKKDASNPAKAATTTTTPSPSEATTTVPSTESTDTTASTEPASSAVTTATTVPSTPRATVTIPNTPNTTPFSQPQTTLAAPAAINFFGPASPLRLRKFGSISISASNSGGGAGEFNCSTTGPRVEPGQGSLNPGASQQIVIRDVAGNGATYSLTCVGAGGGRYQAEIVVDN